MTIKLPSVPSLKQCKLMRFDGNSRIENDRLVDSDYTCKTVDTAAQYIG